MDLFEVLLPGLLHTDDDSARHFLVAEDDLAEVGGQVVEVLIEAVVDPVVEEQLGPVDDDHPGFGVLRSWGLGVEALESRLGYERSFGDLADDALGSSGGLLGRRVRGVDVERLIGIT